MSTILRYPLIGRYAAAALLALVGGCADQPVNTIAPAAKVEPAKPRPADAPPVPAKANEGAQADTTPAPIDPTTLLAASQPAEGYDAPFPERGELFAPPKQAARPQRSEGSESTDSVVLMGFANVDTLKVVLAIDGIVSPLAPGAEINGLRVISADPPKAVLQRGRSRWTASIE